MQRLILFALAFAGTAYADPCEAPLPPEDSTFGGVVTHIIDGDGLCVGADDGGIEVRLGDFDARELSQPGGRAAKDALARIALGREVHCHACEGARRSCYNRDRVIAVCRIDGVAIGDLMRADGQPEGGR